jgi:pyruvate/2-oxoglutarate/acetoin dehydrogenase E1 component
MTYRDELTKAMTMLAADERTIFIGQAVAYPGTGMHGTLVEVPAHKRLELPVAEDMQMGMAIGMSLRGYIPVCIYPRINFLLLAMNQLVLHLDKLPLYGNGWRPKVIIRTMVAHDEPMDPGVQHLGDFSPGLRSMLKTVDVYRLSVTNTFKAYEKALRKENSAVLVEFAEHYDLPMLFNREDYND